MSLDTLNNGDSGLAARTKINAAIAAMNAAGAEASANGLADFAFMSPDGNDDTAVIGDPAKPFSTFPHAQEMGAKKFFIQGAVGDMTLHESGSYVIWGIGSTISRLAGISISGPNVVITGNGRSSIYIGPVTAIGAKGENGSSDSDGGVGGTSPNLAISGVSFSTIDCTGGAGGDGGTGDPGNGGNGGAGGTGGDGGMLVLVDCFGEGAISHKGGNGGTGGSASDDGSGGAGAVGANGNGGTGGSIALINVISSITGVPGDINLVGGLGGSNGQTTDGGLGSNGNASMSWSECGSFSNFDSAYCKMSMVAGSFVDQHYL